MTSADPRDQLVRERRHPAASPGCTHRSVNHSPSSRSGAAQRARPGHPGKVSTEGGTDADGQPCDQCNCAMYPGSRAWAGHNRRQRESVRAVFRRPSSVRKGTNLGSYFSRILDRRGFQLPSLSYPIHITLPYDPDSACWFAASGLHPPSSLCGARPTGIDWATGRSKPCDALTVQ